MARKNSVMQTRSFFIHSTIMKQRQSNIELLRIFAMMFVLILHADYAVFGYPKVTGVTAAPALWSIRIFAEQFAIGAVDIFVLISGWFGIRSSLKGGTLYLFQIFFTATLILLGAWICGGFAPITLEQIGSGYKGFWFVWSYLVLYVLSPVLNAYVEGASRRQFAGLLIVLFSLETLDVLLKFSSDFNSGYSAIHFCALYLLARYLKTYNPLAHLSRRQLLAGYFAVTCLCASLIFAAAMWWGNPWIGALEQYLTVYNSPVVVLASVFILLYFNRLNFQNSIVNWLAAGSFNVYLVHQNIFLRNHYKDMVRHIDSNFQLPLVVVVMLGFLCAVFLASVIMDQPRQWIANFIKKRW